jgi:hypothetical protein
MSKIVSAMFKAARLAATVNAFYRAGKTGSPTPLIRRAVNILWGRLVISKLWWKG